MQYVRPVRSVLKMMCFNVGDDKKEDETYGTALEGDIILVTLCVSCFVSQSVAMNPLTSNNY